MAKAALIFNGIRLPFPVVDRAISWAKQHNGSLMAIFLRAENETGEGYVFPSDLDIAENLATTEDAENNNSRVIESNIRILKNQAANEKITLDTKLLVNPTVEDLSGQLTGCEKIFIEEESGEQGILSVESIDMKNLHKNLSIPLEIVK